MGTKDRLGGSGRRCEAARRAEGSAKSARKIAACFIFLFRKRHVNMTIQSECWCCGQRKFVGTQGALRPCLMRLMAVDDVLFQVAGAVRRSQLMAGGGKDIDAAAKLELAGVHVHHADPGLGIDPVLVVEGKIGFQIA